MTRTTMVIFVIFVFTFCKKKSDPEPAIIKEEEIIQEWPPCELDSKVLVGLDTIIKWFYAGYSYCDLWHEDGNFYISGQAVWPLDGLKIRFQKPELTLGKYKISAEPINKDEVSVKLIYDLSWRTDYALEGSRILTAISGTVYVNKLASGFDSVTICDGVAIDENGVEEVLIANITIDCARWRYPWGNKD